MDDKIRKLLMDLLENEPLLSESDLVKKHTQELYGV